MEKSRSADDQVEQMSQALNRLRAMVSLPMYSPPMPWPPTGDCGWMTGSGGVGAAPWQLNAVVCSRVRGLQEALSAATIALEIISR